MPPRTAIEADAVQKDSEFKLQSLLNRPLGLARLVDEADKPVYLVWWTCKRAAFIQSGLAGKLLKEKRR